MKNRTQALYVGANDGMLHAFNAGTGEELWAFIPRQVAPNMWKIADESYATKHQYFVDGSPTSMDVWDGSNWRTILVGGLNAGGRGFYALDVTDPGSPKALWEICSDTHPVLDPDDEPRLLLRQPDHHQARLRRQMGGAGHLRLQQREPRRWKGLAVRAGCHDRRDRGQGQHRRGCHHRAERAGQDRGLGRQLLRRQHLNLCLRR